MKINFKMFLIGTSLLVYNIFFNQISAQSYQLTSYSGQFTALTGGTAISEIQSDNGYTDPIGIGFDFTFGGEIITEIVASSDGYLYLVDDYYYYEGEKSKGFFFDNSLEMMTYWGYAYIAPLWDDLNGDEGKATYKLEGTAPNRVFTIEYLDWKWDYGATSPGISFQVKLYETTNIIEFVYRQETGELFASDEYAGASIGMSDPYNFEFYSLNNVSAKPSLSSTIETNDIFAKPATGQTYQFEYKAKPEATNHVTSFAAISHGISIELSWTDADGEIEPDGYLILASTTNNFTSPQDSINFMQDYDLSDNFAAVKINQGQESFDYFEHASYNATYYFKIFPFSNSGNIIDYKIDGDVPMASTVCSPIQEPSNYVTSFESSTDGTILIHNWTDATGSILPDGYLILTSKINSFSSPVDGEELVSDNDLSDGIGTVYVASGAQSYNGYSNVESFVTYYSRIYSYTNSGLFIDYKTDGIVPQDSVLIVKPEPDTHVTSFLVTNEGNNIKLTWVDSNGETQPDGYIILAANTNNFTYPVDNIELSIDSSLSDGTALVIVPYGVQSFSGWKDFGLNSFYYFKIIPYSNNGIYIDYYLSGEIPLAINFPTNNFIEQTDISLEGAGWGTIEWGDYNNDGFLDILRTGRSPENSYRSVIYKNNGDNTFTEQTAINLLQVTNGTAVWGDYNNDGYLDIVISGSTSSGWNSKIYSNNTDGTFSEQTKITIESAQYSCAAWGDYNNDGFMDLLFSGTANPYKITKLYRNNGDSTFTEQSAIPFNGYYNSFDWGDYNNDGNLDVLTTGTNSEGDWVTRLYKNNGNNTFTEQTNTGLLNVDGTGKWGDFNNDGYLDMVLSGLDGISGYSVSSKMFKNNGNGTFSALNNVSVVGVYYGSLAWGDYNNDGYLDIIITGDPSWDSPQGSIVYRNNGNETFSQETGITLENASGTSVAWADYDNDGDLDVICSGEVDNSGFIKIYKNESFIKNTVPQTPINLNAEVYGRTVNLSWDKSTDVETDQDGLSYNIYIGKSPNDFNVWSPNADTTNGFRIVAKRGTIQTNDLTINNLGGGTYYWSVQAIDGGLSSSEFANQSSFSIIHYNNISPIDKQELILGEAGNPISVTESLVPDSRFWKYGMATGGPYDSIIEGATEIQFVPQFAESGSHFVVCVSKYGNIEVISNEVEIDVQYFTQLSTASIPNIKEGDMEWADLNNDGYLDIILTGTEDVYVSFSENAITKIYLNNGDATFSELSGVNLPGVMESSIACGDYDSDGFIDILISGSTDGYDSHSISKIFRNNGDSTFTEKTEYSLPGIHNGKVAWVDYDNDGDLDILISGTDVNGSAIFNAYKYSKGVFSETEINVIPFSYGNFDLGDFNKDGYIDLITSGNDYSGNRATRIYSNDKKGQFTELDGTNFLGLLESHVQWNDYNNDGYLDFILAGSYTFGSSATVSTKVYKNNGDNTFSELTGTPIPGAGQNSFDWGDYDKDGKIDLVITGFDTWGEGTIGKLFHNDGNNTFSEPLGINFPELYYSTVKWGDYDNDGDLDLFMMGKYFSEELFTGIFRNNCIKTNNKPSVPSNIVSEVIEGQPQLSWESSSDAETPSEAINYNLIVALLPDTAIIKSPLADFKTGFLKVNTSSNLIYSPKHNLYGLEVGKYIWAVQSVDNTQQSSVFSDWNSFEILPQFTQLQELDMHSENVYAQFIDYNADGNLDIYATASSTGDNLSRLYKNGVDKTFTKDTLNILPMVCTANNGGNSLEDYENLNYNAGVGWGDYNNDGYLDVLLAGDTHYYYHYTITKLFSNNGDGTFSEQTKAVFPTFTYGSTIAWGDFDNDGWQDVLIGGLQTSGNGYNDTKLFKNNGDSTFTETNLHFGYSIMGHVSWADYDNDGYQDVLVCGSNYTNLFHNNGEGQLEKKTDISLTGVINSFAEWADYNNDGLLDFVISGMDKDYNRITKLYKNDGNGSFSEVDTYFRGVIGGSLAWADYDNDGDTDLLMSGKSGNIVTIIYRNDGNDVFTEVDYDFDQVEKGYSSFGDMDNDGDLDVVSGGKIILYSNNGASSMTYNLKVYENHGDYLKGVPTKPLDLNNTRNGNKYIFTWDAATDDITPQVSLTYNLRIGTTPGGREILSPLSLSDTNKLLTPALGNCQLSRNKEMNSLAPGTYYWSVQAVDQAYNAGEWADEQTLVVSAVVADFTADTVCAGLPTTFTDISVEFNEPITQQLWRFDNEGTSTETSPTFTFSQAGTYSVTLIVQTNTFVDSISKNVIVKQVPVADFTANPVCFGTSTAFANTSVLPTGFEVSTWSWNFGDGLSNSTPTTENPGTHTFITTGTFSASLSISGKNGCSDNISKDVIVTPQPNANIFISSGSEFNFCKNSGDSAYLYVNSQLNCTYQWLLNDVPLGNSTQTSLTVKEVGGNFKALVTNELGNCVVTSSTAIAISVNDAPTSPAIDYNLQGTSFCSGDSLVMATTALSDVNYLWKRDGGLVGQDTRYVVRQSGVYTLTVQNPENGCEAISGDVVEVNVNSVPVITNFTHGETEFCDGENVVFTVTNNPQYTYQWMDGETAIPGETSNQFTATQSGNYWLQVTNSNNCSTETSQVGVTVHPSPVTPTIDIPSEATICSGDSVLLQVTPVDGVTYQWLLNGGTTGTDSPELYAKASGSYSLMVTNGSGCSKNSSNSITITVNARPTLPIVSSGDTEFCDGENVVFTVTNNPLYTYQWMDGETAIPGETSNQFTATQSGDYWLQVINSSLCTSETTPVEVIVNPSPITPTIDDPSETVICSGDSVLLQVTPVEGVNYQWLLNGGTTGTDSPELYAKASGDYTLMFTNGSGCSKNSSNSIAITVNSKPTLPSVNYGETEFCEGGSVVFTVTNNPQYTYQWMDSITVLTGETSNQFIATHYGNYWLKVTNSSLCTSETTPVEVIVNPSPTTPTIDIPSETVICSGDSVLLQVTPVEGVNYQWLLNGGSTGTDSPELFAKASGSFSLMLTNSSGCSKNSSNSIAITVNSKPTLPSVNYGETEFCEGGSVVFTVTNNPQYTYQWMDSITVLTGETSNQFIATQYGNYWLKVTNSSLCTSETTPVEVIVNPSPITPTIDIPSETVICSGDSVLLQTTPVAGVNYQWLLNGGNTGTNYPELYAKASGSYTLMITNASECSKNSSNSIAITVNAKPTLPSVSYGETEFCEGGNVIFSVTNNTQYTYQWMDDQLVIPNANTNQYIASQSGNYWLQITNNNCSNGTNPVSVTAYEMPDVPTIKEENNLLNFCPGTEVTLMVVDPVNVFDYQWQRSGKDIAGATQSEYQGRLNGGDYSVLVTSGVCAASSSVMTLTTKPAPEKPGITAYGPNIWMVACTNETADAYRWYYEGDLIPNETKSYYVANQNLGNYYVEINEGGDCWTKSDIINIPDGTTTGANELIDELITLFPNPTDGKISFSLGNYISGTIRITLTNELGKGLIMEEYTGVTRFELNLTELPQGIYFAKLEYQDKVLIKKLVRN